MITIKLPPYDMKHDIVFSFAELVVQLANYQLDQRSLSSLLKHGSIVLTNLHIQCH